MWVTELQCCGNMQSSLCLIKSSAIQIKAFSNTDDNGTKVDQWARVEVCVWERTKLLHCACAVFWPACTCQNLKGLQHASTCMANKFASGYHGFNFNFHSLSFYPAACMCVCACQLLMQGHHWLALHLCTWGFRFEPEDPETNKARCKMLTQLLALNMWLNSEQTPKAVQQPALCRHTLGLRFQVRKFKHGTKERKMGKRLCRVKATRASQQTGKPMCLSEFSILNMIVTLQFPWSQISGSSLEANTIHWIGVEFEIIVKLQRRLSKITSSIKK